MTVPKLVKLTNISKSYQKGGVRIAVLNKLSIDIMEGEFVCMMGPSGSGKSTLLNIIAGFDRADEGEVSIAGEVISGFSDKELTRWRSTSIGFVFQNNNLLPQLTALQNVEVPLLLQKLTSKQRKKRVDAALDLVNLQDRAKHHPHELSGGQEQRVAIARAIVSDAPLLLCDEPTGDLDRNTADLVLRLLVDLQKQLQKTILLVSHDQNSSNYSDRTINLSKGQLDKKSKSVDESQIAESV